MAHFLKIHFIFGKNKSANHHPPSECIYCHMKRSGKRERLLKHMVECKNVSAGSSREAGGYLIEFDASRRKWKSNVQVNDIDALWGRALVLHGIPLTFMDSIELKEIFSKDLRGYLPPSRSTVRERILPKMSSIALKFRDKMIENAEYRSIMIQLDSWTDPTGRSLYAILLNFTNPLKGTQLHSIIDMTGQSHNSKNIADLIISVIEDVGESKINGIVTDGANSMNLARKLVTDQYKDLIELRCFAHLVNLLIMDISKYPPFKATIEKSI